MLVKVYAQEVAITPIKVNLFNPGPVRTAMRYKAFPGEDQDVLTTPEQVAPDIVRMLSADETRNGELVNYERASR
jgi:short-subunit dehydrogenase